MKKLLVNLFITIAFSLNPIKKDNDHKPTFISEIEYFKIPLSQRKNYCLIWLSLLQAFSVLSSSIWRSWVAKSWSCRAVFSPSLWQKQKISAAFNFTLSLTQNRVHNFLKHKKITFFNFFCFSFIYFECLHCLINKNFSALLSPNIWTYYVGDLLRKITFAPLSLNGICNRCYTNNTN